MSKKKNFFPVFLIFFVLAFLLFVLSWLGFLNGLTGFFESATIPLRKMTFGIVHKDDQTELVALKVENAKLTAQLVKQKELEHENQALRDQFQTANPASSKLLPATVIGEMGREIIIDKGQSDGIKSGNIVVVKDNLIGKVVKTSVHISVIDPITQSNISFTAKTLKSQALGIVKGQDGGIIFDNVVLSDKLEKDDLVITKGDIDAQGAGFPPNLIVGKIVSINKKASSLFQNAQVRSLVDFSQLDSVFVITGQF